MRLKVSAESPFTLLPHFSGPATGSCFNDHLDRRVCALCPKVSYASRICPSLIGALSSGTGAPRAPSSLRLAVNHFLSCVTGGIPRTTPRYASPELDEPHGRAAFHAYWPGTAGRYLQNIIRREVGCDQVSILAAHFVAVPQMMHNDVSTAKAYRAIAVGLRLALHAVKHPSEQFFAVNRFKRHGFCPRQLTRITDRSVNLQKARHEDGA